MYLGDPVNADWDALGRVNSGWGNVQRHDIQREPLDSLETGDDEGPASHEDQGFFAVANARDDYGLVGATRGDADVKTHLVFSSLRADLNNFQFNSSHQCKEILFR